MRCPFFTKRQIWSTCGAKYAGRLKVTTVNVVASPAAMSIPTLLLFMGENRTVV